MSFLIDIINDREKQKYAQNTKTLIQNVSQEITKREYLVPNNAKSSITYFWQNLLLINPAADRHTFPLTFIPTNHQDIIIRTRFSNHPCGPLENWTKYEARGCPNKRVDIYFWNSDDSDNPNGEVETHIISNKHLYSDSDVKLIQKALSDYFSTGNFINPFCNTTNNQDKTQNQINNMSDNKIHNGKLIENMCHNSNNKMKQTIVLMESDLKRVISETVINTLRLVCN